MSKPRTRYRVNVTQADIDEAIERNSRHCAVATAIARCIPTSKFPLVDVQSVRFSLPADRKRLVYLTPPAIQEYIIAFDAGDRDSIEPFSFTLNSPGWITDMRIRAADHPEGEQERKLARTEIRAGRDAEGDKRLTKTVPRSSANVPPLSGGEYKKAAGAVKGRKAANTVSKANGRGTVRTFGLRAMRVNQK